MNNIEQTAEHRALSIVWMQTRAAINGKLGVMTLIDDVGCKGAYLGLTAPNTNANDPHYEQKKASLLFAWHFLQLHR